MGYQEDYAVLGEQLSKVLSELALTEEKLQVLENQKNQLIGARLYVAGKANETAVEPPVEEVTPGTPPAEKKVIPFTKKE